MKEQEETKRITGSPKGIVEQVISSPTIKSSPKSYLLQHVIYSINSNFLIQIHIPYSKYFIFLKITSP